VIYLPVPDLLPRYGQVISTALHMFDPLDFISCLAARVPKSRMNLTRYHGLSLPSFNQ